MVDVDATFPTFSSIRVGRFFFKISLGWKDALAFVYRSPYKCAATVTFLCVYIRLCQPELVRNVACTEKESSWKGTKEFVLMRVVPVAFAHHTTIHCNTRLAYERPKRTRLSSGDNLCQHENRRRWKPLRLLPPVPRRTQHSLSLVMLQSQTNQQALRYNWPVLKTRKRFTRGHCPKLSSERVSIARNPANRVFPVIVVMWY